MQTQTTKMTAERISDNMIEIYSDEPLGSKWYGATLRVQGGDTKTLSVYVRLGGSHREFRHTLDISRPPGLGAMRTWDRADVERVRDWWSHCQSIADD